MKLCDTLMLIHKKYEGGETWPVVLDRKKNKNGKKQYEAETWRQDGEQRRTGMIKDRFRRIGRLKHSAIALLPRPRKGQKKREKTNEASSTPLK
jgi:hypothetical protein